MADLYEIFHGNFNELLSRLPLKDQHEIYNMDSKSESDKLKIRIELALKYRNYNLIDTEDTLDKDIIKDIYIIDDPYFFRVFLRNDYDDAYQIIEGYRYNPKAAAAYIAEYIIFLFYAIK